MHSLHNDACLTALLHASIAPISAVNGGWAEWSSWTDCSAPCGFAFQSRHRLCNKPKPVARGEPCYGLAYMTSICRTDFCKGIYLPAILRCSAFFFEILQQRTPEQYIICFYEFLLKLKNHFLAMLFLANFLALTPCFRLGEEGGRGG